MKPRGTPLQPYCKEREDRLDQIKLKAMRKITGNQNMSVQEMREMLKPKQESTIKVTFLKKTK